MKTSFNQLPLYYIAIVVDDPVQEQVQQLKERIKSRFGIAHALKSPAHITLQMPFRLDSEKIEDLKNSLLRLATTLYTFEIKIIGYGHFDDRVIYISVNGHKKLNTVFEKVQDNLSQLPFFTKKMLTSRFHPHLTLAHRDLSKDLFKEVWVYVNSFEISGTIKVNNFTILKHAGLRWNIDHKIVFNLLSV